MLMMSSITQQVLSPIQVRALEQKISFSDFEIKSTKVEESKVEVKTEPDQTDSKAVIRAALLRAIERKKQLGK